VPVVADSPRTDEKTLGLWDRDVCEIFVAPDAANPEHYFEFEAAPTGEWLDLGIISKPNERETNWDYASGMRTAVKVEGETVMIVVRVPWPAFGSVPATGDRWRINFFRCVGKDPGREYLVWRPTRTPEPCFHDPRAFGELLFL
jgi:hypothetical protein